MIDLLLLTGIFMVVSKSPEIHAVVLEKFLQHVAGGTA